jgi:hypothetical protein
MAIGQELLNVPMGDMIRQMAFAIAEAQIQLDENAIDVAEMMGGLRAIRDEDGNVTFDDSRVFFGYQYMTKADAETYGAADAAVSGNDDLKDLITQVTSSASATDEVRIPTRVSMLELGFTPTFYQFVDTIIEVKIAIKITRNYESSVTRTSSTQNNSRSEKRKGGGILGAIFGGGKSRRNTSSVSTSQVDASYSSKYGYSAEGASLLRTKIAPVPPPPILEERIRDIMEFEQSKRDAALVPVVTP